MGNFSFEPGIGMNVSENKSCRGNDKRGEEEEEEGEEEEMKKKGKKKRKGRKKIWNMMKNIQAN